MEDLSAVSWTDLVAKLDDWQPGVASPTSAEVRHNAAWGEIHRRLLQFARTRLLIQLPLAIQDAEDVAQSTLLKLQHATAWRRLKSSDSILGYLHVMMRNQAIDLRRRRSKYAAVLLKAFANRPTDYVWSFDLNMSSEDFDLLISGLAPDDQQLLRMRFWQDLSMVEMARKLCVPYPTLAGRMFRSLNQLREIWGIDS